jgi:hypothetical protein
MAIFELFNPVDLLAIPLFALACPLASINVLSVLISWLHCPSKPIINCCQLSALLSTLLSELVTASA